MAYSVEYLERLVAAVGRFEAAFEAWMLTQNETGHNEARGIFPTVWTKEDADPAEERRLALDVAEAAGEAARAVSVTGAHIGVQGIGAVDPIANWSMMSNPKAYLSPQDIRMTAATIRGRLGAMISDAADGDLGAPTFAPAQMHPVVWSAAAAHWTTHQRRVAVREAAEGLTIHWKERLGRNDVDDTEFWQQTLSPGDPSPGAPKLVWPGNSDDKTAKSMRGGLEPLGKALNLLATGLNLTVRNVTTHTRAELPEQQAMERLAAYSYFARLLDQCEIKKAEGDADGGT